jgi:hypothetical protein
MNAETYLTVGEDTILLVCEREGCTRVEVRKSPYPPEHAYMMPDRTTVHPFVTPLGDAVSREAVMEAFDTHLRSHR